MSSTPTRTEQIIQTHAELIVNVVAACHNPDQRDKLQPVLEAGETYGQLKLVGAIRRILAGERETSLLQGLDEDDAVIVEAILRGLQDPQTLPDPNAQPDPSAAAPGLAHMVHAAAHGSTEALEMLGHMAEQMAPVGGDMARLGGIMRRLVNGERDADELCKGMSASGESLVVSILEELGRMEAH